MTLRGELVNVSKTLVIFFHQNLTIIDKRVKIVTLDDLGGIYFMLFHAMLMNIEDEQERQKISDIYRQHCHKCLYIALKILKKQELAEDAVGDAFIEVIKQKDKILAMSCSDLVPYLVTIVKSRAINIAKKQNRISDTPIEELAETIESNDVSVEDQIINKQSFESLIAHVAKLDETHKVTFEMKYVHGMSNGEIAETLGINKKNVETRLYRAKQKLRKIIESEVKTNG